MSKIKALINPVTPFQQNAPIIYCTETNKCAFVDPGGDIEILLESAKQNNLIPEKILLTHAHIDHAGGAHELSRILNLKIEGPHTDDQFLIETIEEQGQMMGIPAKKFVPDVWFDDSTIEIKIRNFANNYISFISKHPYIPSFIIMELNKNPDFVLKIKSNPNFPNLKKFNKQVEKEVENKILKPINSQQLFMNIISMCIFPFVASPLVKALLDVNGNNIHK